MPIKFSEYIRQEKKTFQFRRMSGGAYGCNIEYGYGYFNGNRLDGMYFSLDKHTEFEDDPDEKDGIGGMRPVRTRSFWLGSFVDGKRDGFCVELSSTDEITSDDVIYFEMGEALTTEEFKEKSTRAELENNEVAYFTDKGMLIYEGENLLYKGQLFDDEKPCFSAVCNGDEVLTCGFFRGEDLVPFLFEDWEKMPVDPIDEDGFSVLREMTFFYDGDLRYEITEGSFVDGKLNGFGTVYYDTNVNGYHNYHQMSGVFKDGKFVFGYKNGYENAGGRKEPTGFGYADGRDIEEYGEEILYEGKRYIGEAKDGVPCGIGCLYLSDDKRVTGYFKNGRLHGIGATFKLVADLWIPYDFIDERTDQSCYRKSWGIFVDGELQPQMTWEEFFEKHENVRKV